MSFFEGMAKRGTKPSGRNRPRKSPMSPPRRSDNIIGKREALARNGGKNMSKRRRTFMQNQSSGASRKRQVPRGRGAGIVDNNNNNKRPRSGALKVLEGSGKRSGAPSRRLPWVNTHGRHNVGNPPANREELFSVSCSSSDYFSSSLYTSEDENSEDIALPNRSPPRRISPPMQRPEPSIEPDVNASKESSLLSSDSDSPPSTHPQIPERPSEEVRQTQESDDPDATQLPQGSDISEESSEMLPTLDAREDDEMPLFDHMTSDDLPEEVSAPHRISESLQSVINRDENEGEDMLEPDAPTDEDAEFAEDGAEEEEEEAATGPSLTVVYTTVGNGEVENPVRSLSALASLSNNDSWIFTTPPIIPSELVPPLDVYEGVSEESEKEDTNELHPPKSMNGEKAKAKPAESPCKTGRKQRMNAVHHKNKKKLIDIRSIMTDMNYKPLRVSGEARKAISDTVKYFAKMMICGLQEVQESKDNHAKTIHAKDVIYFISVLVPSGAISARMQSAVLHAIETRRNFSNHSVGLKGKTTESKKSGLHISRAMVKSMCDIHAAMTSFYKPSYISIAACLEQMAREIIHRTVGVVLKDTNDFERVEDVPVTRMHTTIELYHVNMALHYIVGIDAIHAYSSNPIFAHRKHNYEEELEKELGKKRNAKRPKQAIKKRVRKSVADHNAFGLMSPEEVLYHMAVDNAIPILFKDMKFSSASLIPNVRFDMLPSYMVDKYSGRVTGEAYMRSNPESVRILEFLCGEYYRTGRGNKWKACLE